MSLTRSIGAVALAISAPGAWLYLYDHRVEQHRGWRRAGLIVVMIAVTVAVGMLWGADPLLYFLSFSLGAVLLALFGLDQVIFDEPRWAAFTKFNSGAALFVSLPLSLALWAAGQNTDYASCNESYAHARDPGFLCTVALLRTLGGAAQFVLFWLIVAAPWLLLWVKLYFRDWPREAEQKRQQSIQHRREYQRSYRAKKRAQQVNNKQSDQQESN